MSATSETTDPQASQGVVVRETRCKTVLNKTSIGDYSLNCYTGCAHACVYCYARFMQRFRPHSEPWGKFVDIKVNAVEALQRQLRRATPGSVFMSSACDGWQPAEAEWKLTRRCCERLLARGFQVNVLTKSALVLRDLDVLSQGNAPVGVTLTTLDETLAALWEPRASSVRERLTVLEQAKRAGLPTSVMFGPLLPFLSDDQASIDALFRAAADLNVDVIWVDALNPRPRVWPAVEEFLRRHDRELLPKYGRMLHHEETRQAYLADLRQRVTRAAAASALPNRLAGCP
jgi:DNA repair photolyase